MSDKEEGEEEARCEMGGGDEPLEEPERPPAWTSGWDDDTNDVEDDPDPHGASLGAIE